MARPPKVSNQVLIQTFSGNHDYAKTGKIVGLDPSTVRRRLKNLKINGAKTTMLESAGRLVIHGVDAFAQIIDINNKAVKLLDDLLEGDISKLETDQKLRPDSTTKTRNQALAVKVMAEIRGQLKTQLDYMNCLYDMKAAAEFQKAVIDSIGECAPEVKRAILDKLQSERAIRASVQF